MHLGTLVETLEAAGQRAEIWGNPDGTRVLVLQHGGRVLGLFPPADGDNFLWTHRALESAATARSFYESDLWHNSGGDRTWLAPEVDLFFPNYPVLDEYWQQRELDPGQYILARTGDRLHWSTRANLLMSRSKETVAVELSKRLSPAPDPLRYEPLPGCEDVAFAGYTLTTSLQLTGTPVPLHLGLWSLLQMPHGGELLVATSSPSEPKVLMGEVAPQDLVVEQHLTRYHMRAPGEHKLGMRAATVTGRAGYLWSEGDRASLVIRNFRVNPSGEYVDVPWLEPDNVGFALQACNVNSQLGAFSELEYHVPAIGSASGLSRSDDESQVWAYRGPLDSLRSIARRLLSAEV